MTIANEEHRHDHAPEIEPVSAKKALVGAAVFLIVAGGFAVYGIVSRMHDRRVLADETRELAPPTVVVAQPKLGSPVNSFVLPGNLSAFTDSPIYARTAGYLTRWYFDIGAHVKKGALLAEIASPEVDQQLKQAEADLETARANAANAKAIAERYTGLVKSDAVSKQDTETFQNQAASTNAAVNSAQANVNRLHELKSFEKIYAPFDGVITARTIDVGQLIDTGTTRELFHLQAIQTLRVYVSVPETNSAQLRVGENYSLTLIEHPGKTYTGKLVRTTDAIDPVSRTLLVEIDVDNRNGELMPGSLANVTFKTPTLSQSLILPVSALIFRHEGLRVATLNGKTVHLNPVVIGEDDGQTVQIISGIKATDAVIQDPPDSLIDNEEVRVVTPTAAGGK